MMTLDEAHKWLNERAGKELTPEENREWLRIAAQFLVPNPEQRRWWERYSAYLQTAEWQTLRARVLDRCQRVCEGCGERPAADVHHLSYRHVGQEFLFELVGLCRECHERLHSTSGEYGDGRLA